MGCAIIMGARGQLKIQNSKLKIQKECHRENAYAARRAATASTDYTAANYTDTFNMRPRPRADRDKTTKT